MNYFSKLNFDFNPEILFIGLLLVCLLLYGLGLGRTKAVFSFLGIYIAYAVQSVFPYWDWLDRMVKYSLQDYFTKIGFFLIVYFAVFLILNRTLAKNRLTIAEASFFAVTILSVLQLGLLLAIVLNMLPVGVVAGFLPVSLAQYFITPVAVFCWFAAPVLALLLVKKSQREK